MTTSTEKKIETQLNAVVNSLFALFMVRLLADWTTNINLEATRSKIVRHDTTLFSSAIWQVKAATMRQTSTLRLVIVEYRATATGGKRQTHQNELEFTVWMFDIII
ncbi:hypothetical protein PoB_002058700 [Plakobranchus ocellatus]|uniref:Uncharacterized protein n=1 Tax=Plakobranchus ocellatus TaxID=259542 RepID=A0AAV3ZFJ1_9GAST|nr:hypothetical protein PoB_002058700 [Plakobranchus ocellatus]